MWAGLCLKEEEGPERDGRAVAPLFWFVTVHVFLSDIDGFPTKSLFQTQDSTFSLLFLLNTLLKWLLLICKQIKNGLMVGESYMKRMPAHPTSIAGEDSGQFFNLLLNNHASCGNTHFRNVIVPSE